MYQNVAGADVTQTSGPRHERFLRRWMSTWVILGAVIVAVTAGFLVLISNSLVGINHNLAVADRAVTGVAGHTETLPGQITDVNVALGEIDAALVDLPGDSRAIRTNLADIVASLRTIDSSLQASAPKLAATADDLVAADEALGPLAARLRDTSALLDAILASTGHIDASLVEIRGTGGTGLAGVDRRIDAVNDILRSTAGDLGNILDALADVNGHLGSICRNPAVNTLHGVQQC
jgi:hypothetical protein